MNQSQPITTILSCLGRQLVQAFVTPLEGILLSDFGSRVPPEKFAGGWGCFIASVVGRGET